MDSAIIAIRKNKIQSLQRFHPWVFSGAIHSIDGSPADGDLVKVVDAEGRFIGRGHYQTNGSISVRVLTFTDEAIDNSFWQKRFEQAIETRQSIGLVNNSDTNLYRLIHAEGDLLPGLIVDVYNDTAVIQCHSVPMHQNISVLANTIRKTLPNIKYIYDKSLATLPDYYVQGKENGYIGETGEGFTMAKENGIVYKIDWIDGQKTGFFVDQRENRYAIGLLSKGKKVLNTFCYSGGFSLAAIQNGAATVHSLDSSAKALELVNENIAFNKFTNNFEHKNIQANALEYIKEADTDYDIIILDPPAFAKHVKHRHKAIQAYKRLNATAIQKIKPGGIIATFSCSQVVDKYLFNNTITAAAIEAKRSVKILQQLHQPADHPVNIFHPESEYLKGLIIKVD